MIANWRKREKKKRRREEEKKVGGRPAYIGPFVYLPA
jgi:hypothetical protein